jgi:hypothetical protein
MPSSDEASAGMSGAWTCAPTVKGDGEADALERVGLDSIPSVGARGMKAVEELAAVLGVVTVRLHEETLKQLLIDGVSRSDAPQTVKQRLTE